MSRVAVVGAHGRVGQQLLRLLYDEAHEAVGVIRNPDHVEDVYRLGGEAVVFDLESGSADDLAAHLAGVDAVVFTAGAGPGSGSARKATVDLGGSLLSIEAAQKAGVRRFVQISAIGIDRELPSDTEETWRAYVEAKRDADAALRSSGLDWTIIRPGGLLNEEGTGSVSIGTDLESGSIPREDVAAVAVAVLAVDGTIGSTFDLVSGDTPVAEAVARIGGAAREQ